MPRLLRAGQYDEVHHRLIGRLAAALERYRPADPVLAPIDLTIDPEGLRLVQKGKRKGIELTWEAMVGGDAALAVELRASLNRLNP